MRAHSAAAGKAEAGKSTYDRVVRIHQALRAHRHDLEHGLRVLRNPLSLERYSRQVQALHAAEQLRFCSVHLRFGADIDTMLRELTEGRGGEGAAKGRHAPSLKVYVAVNAALLAARDDQSASTWGQRCAIETIDQFLLQA